MFSFCFTSICLFPYQCASWLGSAEPSTNKYLVVWPAHNLLIAWPAPLTHIFFWFAQTITILPVYLYFWVWSCLYIFNYHVPHFFIPVCSHRLSSMTKDHHQKGSSLLSWRTKSNLSPHSFVSTQSCLLHSSSQNPHYPVQAPPTSNSNWSEKTPSYPNSGIKTLEPTPWKAASP